MFVDAGRSVGSSAAAEFDLSLFEVVVELTYLCFRGFEVVIGWPQCPAPVEEAAEVSEGFLVVDGCIALGCRNVLMAHELGENVYGQPSGQG
nr:hypothetical protein [Arthrobacter sp. NicSoilC12]